MAEPKCPYFNKCGGCQAQHIEYEVQLKNKAQQLRLATKVEEPLIFSADPYEYRNRMDLVFTNMGLGFRQKGKWNKFVPVKHCAISNPRLNELLDEVHRHFPEHEVDYFNLNSQQGTYKYCVIRTPCNDSSLSFVLNQDSSKLAIAVEKIKQFAEVTSAKNVIITYVNKKTDMSISEEYAVIKGSDNLKANYMNKDFEFNVQGFFQNNDVMAEKMQNYVHSLLAKYPTKGTNLLDLYGGVGTFGIINSDLFESTTIAENFKGSIDSAQLNIKSNQANAHAYVLDAQQIQKLDLRQPLYIITDPPRSGMTNRAISKVVGLEPKAIIYISCNLKQLRKEIPRFKGYEVKSAAMFDLFPHTNHAEGIVELVPVEEESK